MHLPLAEDGTGVGESSNSSPNPSSVLIPEDDNHWSCYRDDEVMQQHSAIRDEEAARLPYVGDKEPISALAVEFQSGSPILQEKIKLLGEQYASLRRTRGDGNCFFRSFMFCYLEHILETQDKAEVDRITANIEECKKTLQSLGYADFTFEDFFTIFIDQLESVLHGKETLISHEELLQRSRDPNVSDYVVMFFRFVTSGEIRRRADFFEPFIAGLTNTTVHQVVLFSHLSVQLLCACRLQLHDAFFSFLIIYFWIIFGGTILAMTPFFWGSMFLFEFCKSSVEPMGEESDHIHITALSDALGVPIRVLYLDRSSCDPSNLAVNHHDFIPCQNSTTDTESIESGAADATKPFVTLLYRPGHYDILYSNSK